MQPQFRWWMRMEVPLRQASLNASASKMVRLQVRAAAGSGDRCPAARGELAEWPLHRSWLHGARWPMVTRTPAGLVESPATGLKARLIFL